MRDLSGRCCSGVALFFLENIYGRARRFPFQLHGAAGAGLVERNREVLKWRRQLGNFHLYAGEVRLRARIRDSELAGLLADDQRPFVLGRQGKQSVAPCGNSLSTNNQIRIGHK